MFKELVCWDNVGQWMKIETELDLDIASKDEIIGVCREYLRNTLNTATEEELEKFLKDCFVIYYDKNIMEMI